ncbi:MAG: hypothetical protein GQ574_03715 [Crocinitomix sp.]|nr:hypothetical protein [Crocinitomix sp.]
MQNLVLILTVLIISGCSDKPDFERLEFSFNRTWEPSTFYNFDIDKKELEVYRRAYWKWDDTTYYKTFDLSETNADLFYEEIHAIKYDSSLSVAGSRGLDGQSFRLFKISEDHGDSIACINPHRGVKYNGNGEFEKEYQILSALFNFIAENIEDSAVYAFSNKVYTGFDGRLSFKQISENPLHYSVWGRQNFDAFEGDSLKLVEFIANLPVNQNVIIELNSLTVNDFYKIDPEKSKNFYFYGSYRLNWLKDEFTWIETEDDESSGYSNYAILDSLCKALSICVYNDSDNYKHKSFHKWENYLIEINNTTPHYYSNKSAALKAQ